MYEIYLLDTSKTVIVTMAITILAAIAALPDYAYAYPPISPTPSISNATSSPVVPSPSIPNNPAIRHIPDWLRNLIGPISLPDNGGDNDNSNGGVNINNNMNGNDGNGQNGANGQGNGNSQSIICNDNVCTSTSSSTDK
jgi:hypothetical protein